MRRILELDGLRFLAISAVIGIHYVSLLPVHLDAFAYGWMGVDLFFVISGYLITTILVGMRESEHSFAHFYWRRTLRIFPAYYLILFILAAISWHEAYKHVVIPQEALFLGSINSHAIPAILGNIHKLLHRQPLNNPPVAPYHPLSFDSFYDGFGVFWSLSVEELFYLLWAPIVLLCRRNTVLLVSLATIVICPALRALAHTPALPEAAFFPCRFDSLMSGSLLALLLLALKRNQVSLRTVKISLTLMVMACLPLLAMVLRHYPLEIRQDLLFATLGYSLIAFFCAGIIGLCVIYSQRDLWWTKVLRSRPLTYIGSISYMIYLIHLPVVTAVYKVVHPAPHTLSSLAVGAMAVLLTVAIAAVSWQFFESPLLRYKDRLPWLSSSPEKV